MIRSPHLYLYSLILDPEWRQEGILYVCVHGFYSLCSPDFMLTRLVLI